jgi:DNA-binding NtrC family response regulator
LAPYRYNSRREWNELARLSGRDLTKARTVLEKGAEEKRMLESAQIKRTTPPGVSQSEGAPDESAHASLNLRLGLIRETALSLLDQLEPLSREQPANGDEKASSLYDEVRRFEIHLIRNALSQTRGHQKRAARLLGVKATTLNAKLKRYKILPYLRGWSLTEGSGGIEEDEN